MSKCLGGRCGDPNVQRSVGPNIHLGSSHCYQDLLESPSPRSMGGHYGCRPHLLHGAGLLAHLSYCLVLVTLPVQAGEGLFAIDALPSGSIVSLFNGIRLKTATVAAQNRAPSDYRIRLNADIDIDIPHECISLEVK